MRKKERDGIQQGLDRIAVLIELVLCGIPYSEPADLNQPIDSEELIRILQGADG